ncbi:SpoIIE family protein phosphatase [Streptomyces sp. NPDC002306]
MTMTSQYAVTLGKQLSASDMSDTAIALLDQQGTVVGWTQAAERLVRYSAPAAVGRSAAFFVPSFGGASTTSAFVDRCRVRNGWSGTAGVRHRDGRVLDVSLRISMLRGCDGEARWLLSLVDTGALSGEELSAAVRGRLLSRAPIGVVVRDRQLRCVFTNDAMERHDGVPADRRLGRRCADAQPAEGSDVLEALMRQVFRSGAPLVHEYRMWLSESLDRDQPGAVSFHCLLGADGRPLGVCVISADVTESRRARERLGVLSRAGTRLGSTLDVMQAGQELADVAVPLLADYVAVDLEQSVPFGEGPPVRVGPQGDHLPVFRRAGLASIHQGAPESPWLRGEPVQLPDTAPAVEVLRTGRSHLEPVLDAAPGTWLERAPALAERIRRHGAHSLMVVPIRTRRAVLGMVVFLRTEDPTPFQDVDLLLAEELVSRAAQSLDNARRYAREHTAALALQRNLLPRRLAGGMAVDVASRYLPADVDHGVGGDWFDVIQLSGARVALVVGDVVGHGVHAAAIMGRLRAAVGALADMDLPPDEVLGRLDATVQRMAAEDAGSPRQASAVGATCLFAVYDPATRRCAMARAGHPPPAIVDPRGRVSFPDLPAGTPLGIGMGDPFETVELELPEGSLLALYTDGLIEARDHDIEEGMRRLGTALAQPGRSLDDLCDLATDTRPGREAPDDITLLLVRTRSLSPARVASWTLPGDETAVSRARNLAALQLAEWGLDGLKDSMKLIVSELVTNAVRHSDGPIGLRLLRHRALTCEVFDSDICSPRLRRARITDESGRGLFMIAQMSRSWGARSVPGGKVVWVEMDPPAGNMNALDASPLATLPGSPA